MNYFIYFSFAIISGYFQHYEYIFTDKNNTKEYAVFSEGRYVYIRLENNMLTEGQFPDFRIKEVYEDKNNFIGCDYDYNYKTDKKEERYYIVIDNISDDKFTNIYTFLKKKGTKIGRYR